MKETVLKSAKKLKQPNKMFAQEFSNKWESLAAKSIRAFMERPDSEKLVGKGNLKMAEDNSRNFPMFMAALFSDYQADVFIETVLWVFRVYRSHGFQAAFWAAHLNIWVDLLKKELTPKAFEEIYPFYNWLIVNIPVFIKLTDLEISDYDHQSPCGDL